MRRLEAVIIGGGMMVMVVFVVAPLMLMAALALALRATLVMRRGQAANDHDTPLITSCYRTQMRWAAGMLPVALALLAAGAFSAWT